MTWTELCEKNANHYDEHPAQHNALTGIAALGAIVAIVKIRNWAARSPERTQYL
jgi:hypothetical protein